MITDRNEETIVYSVSKAAEVLGISKALLYGELKKNPLFPRKMIGGRIMIPAQKLKEYFNN
ncbi:MAG: helix-turn-helix domain-containing protein [Hungatella sp.]|jgi:predicted DNA-binding transcriptional regulator AlpA|nr:helix-turn-helix domain-containing protein [Hungatella sp.]